MLAAFLPCLPAPPGASASTPSEPSPDSITRTQCAQHAHDKHTHTHARTHARARTHAHTHTTHDALRRSHELETAGDIEILNNLPDEENEDLRRRTFLRVPLRRRVIPGAPMPRCSAPPVTWQVQLVLIKSGRLGTRSHLGSNPFQKRILLFGGVLARGSVDAANASRLGVRTIPVTLGDANLTVEQVTTHPLAQSNLKQGILCAASEGAPDGRGHTYQDLIVVGADYGDESITMKPKTSDVRGYDGCHRAVRACIIFDGPAASPAASQAAASMRGARAPFDGSRQAPRRVGPRPEVATEP